MFFLGIMGNLVSTTFELKKSRQNPARQLVMI